MNYSAFHSVPTDELLRADDDLLSEGGQRYLNNILLNNDNDRFCTVSRSACKLGGSRRPQSPTVSCLSEQSDIASYYVDISPMFASLIQLNIIYFCVIIVNLN